MFRLTTAQQFLVDTMEVTPLPNIQSEGRSASRPLFIKGFPIFGHFYPVYTPILAYLIRPWMKQHKTSVKAH